MATSSAPLTSNATVTTPADTVSPALGDVMRTLALSAGAVEHALVLTATRVGLGDGSDAAVLHVVMVRPHDNSKVILRSLGALVTRAIIESAIRRRRAASPRSIESTAILLGASASDR